MKARMELNHLNTKVHIISRSVINLYSSKRINKKINIHMINFTRPAGGPGAGSI